ncbi:MAG: hypothetical protein SPH68_01115 [Candidatus Borkfalkiaceae bacterium]|nr:hypothetical protein [Clostridia bacterium]MDY6222744.1 hypothetical protein [Christensenellaceae bacterium]
MDYIFIVISVFGFALQFILMQFYEKQIRQNFATGIFLTMITNAVLQAVGAKQPDDSKADECDGEKQKKRAEYFLCCVAVFIVNGLTGVSAASNKK